MCNCMIIINELSYTYIHYTYAFICYNTVKNFKEKTNYIIVHKEVDVATCLGKQFQRQIAIVSGKKECLGVSVLQEGSTKF